MDAMKTTNLWQEAVKQKTKQVILSSVDKIIIVVGHPSTGKTSFLKVIKNEAQSEVKPTTLLEYSYIRKGAARKQLINCYQIASKNQSDIIPSFFTKDNFTNVTVAICIDLSKPASIIEEIIQWLSILKKQIGNAIHQRIGMQQRYDDWLIKRKQEIKSHEDVKSITVSPINIIIVGCKYDLYEKYQTQNRKWLSKTLRYLAHANNCSLAFCSTKNAALGLHFRTVIQQIIFQEKPKIISQKDHLKPIYVYRNQDNLGSIGIPSSGSISGIEVLRRQLSGLFTNEQQKKRQGIDITKYLQSKIENVIQERKKELTKISKNINKKNLI